MALNKVQIRRLHFAVAPIAFLPLFLTVITGSLFQVAIVTDHESDFYWLLALHVGKFGALDLSLIYPFLNAFAALMIVVTGILIWLQTPRRRSKPS
jgi:hypothetical protein